MRSKVLCLPFIHGAGHSWSKLEEEGFSLIEVVIAIAVVALTFIGIIGLLGVGVVSDQASSQGTIATNIAGSILADLRSTPGNVPGSSSGIYTIATISTRYGLPLPTTVTSTPSTPLKGLTAPTLSVLYFDNAASFISLNPASVPSNAVYVARVYPAMMSCVGPGANGLGPNGAGSPAISGMSQYDFMVRILVSWPAQATANPGGSIDVTSQFIVH